MDHIHTMLALVVFGHVPTYDAACVENCCTPPHTHTTSQVFYLKGSGGLEVHLTDDRTPFDTIGGELLDVDAVFRDEIDQSTYDLYIGCGGCVASADPIVIPPLALHGYEPVVIEPFTQTAYRSVLPKGNRTFDASQLKTRALEAASGEAGPYDAVTCDQKHFTIRLVDYGNRTDGKPIVWGAVLGLGESFTPVELLSFPIYILRNHDEWNDLPWTFWVWLFCFAPLLFVLTRLALKRCGVDVLDANPLELTFKKGSFLPSLKLVQRDWREPLYEFALIALVAAAGEEVTHLLVVTFQNPGAELGGLFVGLGLVVLLGQGLPALFVWAVWHGLKYRSKEQRCPCLAWKWWAPLEILTGVSLFFFFGAGFFITPSLVVIAGLLRLRTLFTADPLPRKEAPYVRSGGDEFPLLLIRSMPPVRGPGNA